MYNFLSLYEYFSSRALSDTEKPQCLSVSVSSQTVERTVMVWSGQPGVSCCPHQIIRSHLDCTLVDLWTPAITPRIRPHVSLLTLYLQYV